MLIAKLVRTFSNTFIVVVSSSYLCWSALGQINTNQESTGKIVASNPRSLDLSGNYLAGRHAFKSSDFSAAATFLKEVLSNDTANPDILWQSFISLAAIGEMNGAAKIAFKQLEKVKFDTIARLFLVVQSVRNQKHKVAQQQLHKIKKSGDVHFYTATLISAWLFVIVEKYDEALIVLESVSQVSALKSIYLHHKALIMDLAGDVASAEKAFRDAIRATNSSRTMRAYGNFLQRLGRVEEAKSVFNQHDALTSNKIQYFISGKADINVERLVKTGRDGIAEALFTVSASLGKDYAINIALIYCRMALWVKPIFPDAKILMGDLFDHLELKSEALNILASIDKNARQSWYARLKRTEILNALKREKEAEVILRNMAKEKPDRTDALIQLGDVLRAAKKYAPAAQAYSNALQRIKKIREEDWKIFYSRGIAYERSKKWDHAEDDFLRALKLSPNQPFVLNYLGYSWVEQGRNLSRAQKMIEEAVRLRPNDGYIVDSLGWVLFRLGRFEKATMELEKAVLLKPSDPTINDHLGDAYWMVGRVLEATFQWRRALALQTDPKQKAIIKQKLKKGLPNSGGNETES